MEAQVRVDDDGGAPAGPQDWTNSVKPVQVDVNSLESYYWAMIDVAGQAAGPVGSTLAPMSEMVRSGLLSSTDPQVGTFQEGKIVADIMYQNISDFTAFLRDAIKGVNCIGSAAAVISEMYRNADGTNSAQLGDVAFAFADSGAAKPDNFPAGANTQTYSQEAAAQGGVQFAMASVADDSQASQVIYPASGVTILLFPDGSSKQITSQSGYGYEGTGSKTTTQIWYQGKQVGTQVNESYSIPNGYSYSVRTQSPTGDPTGAGATSTTTRTNPDGSTTIYTTTYDGHGGSKTSNPITVQPDTHATSDDAGPVQQAEQQYGSSGSRSYTQSYGNSY
jgi:hypothetical protein